MNVLYIGPYKQLDRWGMISRIFIKNLREAGVNFMLRPINYSNVDLNISYEEENNKLEYTHVIQHCLPKDFVCDKRYKNIFFFDQETEGFEEYNLSSTFELADDVWVTGDSKNDKMQTVKLNMYDEAYIELSNQENNNAKAFLPTLLSNTTFFCNADIETPQTLARIKDAFSIQYGSFDEYKLVLYCKDIKETEKLVLENSCKLSPNNLNNIIFVGHDSGITEEFLISNSYAVITTPPFININFTLIKSICLGVTPISTCFTQVGTDGVYPVETYNEVCLIDFDKKGTTDFGNTNEIVPMASTLKLMEAMKKFEENFIKLGLDIIKSKNELKVNNIKDIL